MIRILAFMFALIASLAMAHAEPPVCKGIDLLDQLRRADPAIYAAVMDDARAVPNGQSMFWRIERDGVQPSFLLGTAHVTDPRVTRLQPEAEEALNGASVIVLELAELRDQMEMMRATMRHASLMVLPTGQSLWDLIPDGDEPAIRDNPNLPPGGSGSLFGYQPWVVAGMLSVPLCEMQRKSLGLEVLDSRIARVAEDRGVPLIGLETVEEQLGIFAAMPLDLQAKYLVSVARLGSRIPDFFETLISLYDQRNVVAYLPLVRRTEDISPDDAALFAFVEEDLLTKRNHRMAERATALLAEGNAFIAVGALPLPGNEGLVELIRRAGYKVTPVN